MKKNTVQYTIRNVPIRIDQILKQKAKALDKSFNQVALEALAIGSGVTLRTKRDLSKIIGSISEKEAAQMDEEIRLQRQIDPELWK